jgi:ABC-type glycerol-3-phosphate transport system substrate-binding protein
MVSPTGTLSRRALVTAAAAAAWVGAGCNVGRPAAQLTTVRVLAPITAGREARVLAWNRRFSAEGGVHAELLPVPGGVGGSGQSQDAAQAALEAALAGGGGQPALAWLPFDELPRLARRGALRALEPLVQSDRTNLKAFMPAALQPAYGLDARLYALPEQIHAGQLYFNRQHLLDAGIDYRRAGLDFERPAGGASQQ